MLRIQKVVLCAIVALWFVGCGDGNPKPQPGVIVTGIILNAGQPLKGHPQLPPESEPPGEVVFIPVGASSGNESAILTASGSFTAKGWEKGLKPGKYKLAVFHFTEGRGSDGLLGAFDYTRTPIEIEIPADKLGNTLDLGTIDLATVAKK